MEAELDLLSLPRIQVMAHDTNLAEILVLAKRIYWILAALFIDHKYIKNAPQSIEGCM